jgi:hypothetical protein
MRSLPSNVRTALVSSLHVSAQKNQDSQTGLAIGAKKFGKWPANGFSWQILIPARRVNIAKFTSGVELSTRLSIGEFWPSSETVCVLDPAHACYHPRSKRWEPAQISGTPGGSSSARARPGIFKSATYKIYARPSD